MWQEFFYTCPTCAIPAHIEQVSFNAEGGILFEGYCPKCLIDTYFETTAVKECVKAKQKDERPATALTHGDLDYLFEIEKAFEAGA